MLNLVLVGYMLKDSRKVETPISDCSQEIYFVNNLIILNLNMDLFLAIAIN